MNSRNYVVNQINTLKSSGIPLMDAAWQSGLLCLGWPYIFGDRGQECTASRRQSVYNSHPSQKSLITKCQILDDKKDTCSGCQWFPDGQRVGSFDCRGFTYWILLRVYGWELMGAGATSQWNNDDNWSAKGLISDGMPEDTLVCLFYPDANKPNVMAHTGFGYKGQTLECSNGVQLSKKRSAKWTHWAIPKCVTGYTPDPQPEKKPTLRTGSTGPYVTLLQKRLIELGYDVGSTGADGKFGKNTKSAVVAFQSNSGLIADGICGPKTWEALDRTPQPEPAVKTYTVTIPGLSETAAGGLCAIYPGATMTVEGGD